jgi:hypothetical protein
MALYTVPVTSKPDQQFTITMPLAGVNTVYKIRIRYNSKANYWVLTLSDKSGKIILDSIPMITGKGVAFDLLGQFEYLGIGDMAIVNMGNSGLDYPDDITLGTEFLLIWGDFADVQGLVS